MVNGGMCLTPEGRGLATGRGGMCLTPEGRGLATGRGGIGPCGEPVLPLAFIAYRLLPEPPAVTSLEIV
jgi:hypothetical protein